MANPNRGEAHPAAAYRAAALIGKTNCSSSPTRVARQYVRLLQRRQLDLRRREQPRLTPEAARECVELNPSVEICELAPAWGEDTQLRRLTNYNEYSEVGATGKRHPRNGLYVAPRLGHPKPLRERQNVDLSSGCRSPLCFCYYNETWLAVKLKPSTDRGEFNVDFNVGSVSGSSSEDSDCQLSLADVSQQTGSSPRNRNRPRSTSNLRRGRACTNS